MKYIRHHFLSRWLCGLAAAVILNLSVDAPDFYDDSVPEDLTYNDIESVVEWVLEVVLKIENAIPEHDENDANDYLKIKKNFELFHEARIVSDLFFPGEPSFESQRIFGDPNFYTRISLEELLQPPEA